MPDPIIQALDNTIQQSVKTDIKGFGIYPAILALGKIGDLLFPWWSASRDAQLSTFWKSSDHLSGAIYAMISKMTTIPIKVVARDVSIKSHVELAAQYTDILINSTQFGEGWMIFWGRCIEDLLTQDNGMFIEVIGPGPKDGPLEGSAISMSHLDAQRCTRTGNPQYPVVYTDSDGKMYKLHASRVIYASQMSSSRKEMNGVGFCAVSRAVNVAVNLIDIAVYKQEKLGSRPVRQLMITKGGLDPEDLRDAMKLSESLMNNSGLTRFSKSIAVGDRNIPNADITRIDIASLPDGFDEKESTILGMSVIALALGMDARELFPGMESGASKADAIIQHIKQRGKGPGQIIQQAEWQFDMKFLPSFLHATFDNQDDSEDRQNAEIVNVRAQARERNLAQGVTSQRVERENMMYKGEITPAQFEELELGDGRLPDGVEVDILFKSKDKDYSEFLSGVNESNYEARKDQIMEFVVNSRDAAKIKKARQCIAAIEAVFENDLLVQGDGQLVQSQGGANVQAGTVKKPDDSYQQERFGRKLPRNVVNAPDETQNYQQE